jgi:hypothetical protein
MAVLKSYSAKYKTVYRIEFHDKYLSISPIKDRRFLNAFADGLCD